MSDTQTMLRVRGNTKTTIRKIARVRGWTLTETADRATKALVEQLRSRPLDYDVSSLTDESPGRNGKTEKLAEPVGQT